MRHLSNKLLPLFGAALACVYCSGCIGVGCARVEWEIRGVIQEGENGKPVTGAQVELAVTRDGEDLYTTTPTVSDESGRFVTHASMGFNCHLFILPIPFPLTPPGRSLGPPPDEIRIEVRSGDDILCDNVVPVEPTHVKKIDRYWWFCFVPISGEIELPTIRIESGGAIAPGS